MKQRHSVVILGSTGSIGRQTLEVIGAHPERFEVLGLSAQNNLELLASQWEQYRAPYIGIGEEKNAAELRKRIPKQDAQVVAGTEGLCELATLEKADIVLAAISGMAGLQPVFAATKAGKRIAIANKEPLVTAGALLTAEAARTGATLFPVDSEHSALFQLLEGRPKESVSRILLTGSGGPFLHSPEKLSDVTAAQALSHPTWSMGPKVTVDSATLMNKGLEVIEARWLFDMPLEKIDVIIHPQSIIHSLVEFIDGSVLAHLAYPDMRIPIQYALGFPARLEPAWSGIDLLKVGKLTFEAPNIDRFPCLRIAREAAQKGGTAPAVMNAADEVAVAKFLNGAIKFTDIANIVERALESHSVISKPTLEEILETDRQTRAEIKV